MTNNSSEIFGTKDAKELALRSEGFAVALEKSLDAAAIASANPAIDKSFNPEGIAAQISAQREILKDITVGNGVSTGSPIPTGLVPFDLEAPAKFLAPRPTPLRNKLPREKGVGTARRYKRITGITGSGTGGTTNIHPGINETTQNNFAPSGAANALYLARGSKIAYAGDDQIAPYFQFSLSDSVSWAANYAGTGFDPRALSAQSLLFSSMLMEVKMLLMGRGTASGLSGALAAPATVTLTARAAATGETALGLTDKLTVFVTSDAGSFGESVLSSAVTSAAALTSGQVVDVTISAVTGALGFNLYVGHGAAAVASSAAFYQGRTGSRTFTIQGTLATTSKAASAVTADTSAYANGYDGIMAYLTNPAVSGYTNNINGSFNATAPGAEFQTAFAAMYNAVKADPEEILMSAIDRKNMSELLKNNSSTNYRLQVQQSETGDVVLGSVITAIQNESTGKIVDMTVHPWMPQGNAAIMSYNLPIPNSNVSNLWSVVNAVDYTGINWPVTQFEYETSSYWYGGFAAYAPAWSGSITGIAA